MKNHKASNGLSLIITGIASILVLFIIYSRYQDSELVTPEAADTLLHLAHMFYVVLLLAFGAIAFGMYLYHKRKIQDDAGLLKTIAVTTWNHKSRKIFVITFVTYGIFFSLSSGMLVYQPDVIFSYHYGVQIPSWDIAPCCGDIGYMPTIFVYLTEHIGLQIIPINFVLQIIVSYLVGLNMAIAVSAIIISKKSGSLGAIGATTGLFIACPTCAGAFLSLFIGTASSIAASIFLTQLQTALIVITIPILVITPFIMAKKIDDTSNTCSIK